jgi:hypothetical protein
VGLIDGALAAQVALDLRSFQQATGRTLNDDEATRFRDVQHCRRSIGQPRKPGPEQRPP